MAGAADRRHIIVMKRTLAASASFILLALTLSGCFWYGGRGGYYGHPGYGGPGPGPGYGHPGPGPGPGGYNHPGY